MKKLLQGILDFRNQQRKDFLPIFANLALGQKPDTLYIGCSDSRVAVNVFASTSPGDLFVVRNVGNLVHPWGENGESTHGRSEWAAIEFALSVLKVEHIIVCGHSECGAIRAANEGVAGEVEHLKSWIPNKESLQKIEKQFHPNPSLSPLNRSSQANVLQQIENLKSSPLVATKLKRENLKLHAWWFDIANVEVYYFLENQKEFQLLDDNSIPQIISNL